MNEQELREKIAKEVEGNLQQHDKAEPICAYCLALQDAANIVRGQND